MKNAMFSRVRAFFQDDAGPTATEYAVMLALIIVVAVGSISTLGISLSAKYTSMNGLMFGG